jgi:hypothetical protein
MAAGRALQLAIDAAAVLGAFALRSAIRRGSSRSARFARMSALASIRRSVAASPRRTDLLVAALLATISLVQVLAVPIAPRGIGVGIALCSTVPIAFRRTHPVAAAIVGILPWAYPTDGFLVVGFVAVFLLFYSLAARVEDLRLVIAVPTFALALAFVTLLQLDPGVGEWLSTPLAVIAPIAVGRVVRRERAQAERIAVAEERVRIAASCTTSSPTA